MPPEQAALNAFPPGPARADRRCLRRFSVPSRPRSRPRAPYTRARASAPTPRGALAEDVGEDVELREDHVEPQAKEREAALERCRQARCGPSRPAG
jgi:hypothetical protein